MALKVLSQLLQGLSMMHANGVIHHDIKGDNIMFSSFPLDGDDWKIQYIDFGLSCSGIRDCQRFQGGTPYYMPPEITPRGNFKHRNLLHAGRVHDVWSVGMTMLKFIDPTEKMFFAMFKRLRALPKFRHFGSSRAPSAATRVADSTSASKCW
jgi:serine/threonine protein kinase